MYLHVCFVLVRTLTTQDETEKTAHELRADVEAYIYESASYLQQNSAKLNHIVNAVELEEGVFLESGGV